MKHRTSIPKFLQSYLWSVPVRELDVEDDKAYIIHQILAFGNMRALKWLRSQYSRREIEGVFLKKPMRIYRRSAFHFASRIFLDIKKSLKKERYVEASLSSFHKRGS